MATEVWSDLSHELKADAFGSIKKVINEDSVKTSINNILGTRYGERVMLPNFGCGLKDMLFSPMNEDLGNKMIKDVRTAIENWEDRVIINAVNIYQSQDQSSIKIEVVFQIRGYEDIFQTSVTF